MKTHHLCAALAVAAMTTSAFASVAPKPARVGKDRPITRQWQCETGRFLLLNFNPRRIKEEAWLTYAGNRAEVHRVPSASGISYASKDGKVKWHEQDDEGVVEFAGVIDKPVHCKLNKPAGK